MDRKPNIILNRRQVVAKILENRGSLLVISGLGAPTWDVAAVGDHQNNFYLWGAMGGAVLTGLGLALAQPKRRILVITGDGEMLMGLGGLATVAVQKPSNFSVCIIDNQRYGETGMQETHTHYGVDLAQMALGAGFRTAQIVYNKNQLIKSIPILYEQTGPVLVNIKVKDEPLPMTLPPRDGPLLKHRFRENLLGHM
ncbi:MAG: aldehyde dehydrogenase [Rhodospirillaceae bacterium]|nr:aldehyde dehydrogenase [Rhodospirillaceae bacterium]